MDVEGGHQLVGLVGGDVNETSVFEGRGEFLAGSVTGGVRIGLFGGDSVGFHPSEGVVHKSSVASIVSVFGAVDQSLF